jgi:hypothetical protein
VRVGPQGGFRGTLRARFGIAMKTHRPHLPHRLAEQSRRIVVALFLCAMTGLAAAAVDTGADLAALYALQVDRRLDVPADEQRAYAQRLAHALALAPHAAAPRPLPPQYVLLIDRDARVQAALLYWLDAGGQPHFIGASPVSTGRPVGYEHFDTPTGVFEHTLTNPDFRAEGTRNEFGVCGYGSAGRRVYDFGWAEAWKGWGRRDFGSMRLQLHATDPKLLEPRLGQRASKGCIRIPATLDEFLDRYGILDADYERALRDGQSLWLLRPDRSPTPWSGRYLVIVDSARAERPAWSPLPAAR